MLRTILLPENEGGATIDSTNRIATERKVGAQQDAQAAIEEVKKCENRIKELARILRVCEAEGIEAEQARVARLTALFQAKGIDAPANGVKFEVPDPKRPFDVLVTFEGPDVEVACVSCADKAADAPVAIGAQ